MYPSLSDAWLSFKVWSKHMEADKTKSWILPVLDWVNSPKEKFHSKCATKNQKGSSNQHGTAEELIHEQETGVWTMRNPCIGRGS